MPSGADIVVGKASLTITGATGTSVFNGATQTNTYSVTSGTLYGSDTISAVNTLGGGVHVGTYNDNLSTATIANSGTNVTGNYNITYVNGALTITPAQLTAYVTPGTKTYDGTSALPSSTSLTGVIPGTTVNGAANLSLAGSSIGNQAIINGGITLSGANAGDYAIGNIIFNPNANNSLSGINSNGNPTIGPNGGNGSGVFIGVSPAQLTITAQSDAKFYTQTDAQGYANNCGASIACSGTYNGYGISGLVNGEAASVLGVNPFVIHRAGISNPSILGASVYENAGTYTNALTVSGAATIGNYAITYVPGNYTIVPAGQLLIKTTGATNVYASTGANSPSPASITQVAYVTTSGNVLNNLTFVSSSVSGGVTNYLYSDPLGGQVSFAVSNGGPTYSASGNVAVGSYGLTGSVTSTSTNLTNTNAVVTGNNTVTPKAATITATSLTTTYDSNQHVQSYSSTAISGDAVVVSGLASGIHAATYLSNLSASGVDAHNYLFTYVNNPLTITPFQLYANITPGAKTYNNGTNLSSTTGLIAAVSGASLPSDFGNITGTSTLTLSGSGVGTQSILYGGTTLSAASGSVSQPGDYAVVGAYVLNANGNQVTPNQTPVAPPSNGGNPASSGATITVGKATLTITGAVTSLTFNNTNQSNSRSFVLNGLAGGADTVTSISGQGVGLHAGIYSDNLYGAVGSGLSNYNIVYVNGALTITPALLTANVTPGTKAYDGTTALSSITTLSGVLPGTIVNGAANLSLAGASAGNQVIINNGIALSGANASDYAIGNVIFSQNADGTLSGINTNGNPAIGPNNGSGTGVVILVASTGLVLNQQELPIMSFYQSLLANSSKNTANTDSAGTDDGRVDIGKPEKIFVRDITTEITESLLAIDPLPSGALQFAVPEKTVQDLINISGHGFGSPGNNNPSNTIKLLLLPENSYIEPALANGEPLPSGIIFNASNKTFYVEQLSKVNLPIEVKLTLKNQSTALAEKVILVTK